jgi:hypothetical protein
VTAISQAKDTLLRALDQLEQAERDLNGEAERVDLIVTYSIGRDLGIEGWDEVTGWACTPGPKWLHAALLNRAAGAQADAAVAIDDQPEDDEDDG